ncbi:MAG: hypothetical protein HY717_11955 [Planctomycetes bacterium]|nr:hypothetical protein [Planctomycetota bacterium]
METLQINVKGWPDHYVKLIEDYAEQVRKQVDRNGVKLPGELPPLPKWPGIPPVPEEIRHIAYGDE